jgi:glutamate-1-semialdehyde 2,1-aminomutase
MAEYSTQKSLAMFQEAQKWLAGGVDSVARMFPPTFDSPIFFDKGKGSHVWDVDGNEYVDYALGYGPLILGHCPTGLSKAVQHAVETRTTTFGIAHDLEYMAAKKIVGHMPSLDRVRFTNTGTEAVMGAIRLARGFSGKDKILRFEGHYHGWSDIIHWNARSPIGAIGMRNAPRRVPATAGMPAAYGDMLIIRPWNDLDILETTLKRHGNEIAAIIGEPMMCNLGATMQKPGYLKGMRELCDKYDVLMIMDEVITAFRVGITGAQGYYDVKPDITTMAKAIGGGYPVGAFGGRADIMDVLAKAQVTHAGTYNGNTIAMAAVNATLGELEQPGVYERLGALGDRLRAGLEQAAKNAGVPAITQGIGPVAQIWFSDKPVVDYRDGATRASMNMYPVFAKALFSRGVSFNPSQYGVWYISTAHTEKDIDFTVAAAEDAIREMKSKI